VENEVSLLLLANPATSRTARCVASSSLPMVSMGRAETEEFTPVISVTRKATSTVFITCSCSVAVEVE